jgi:hypothetical protein
MTDDERLMRMAEELVYGREALAEALRHLVECAGLLDRESNVESYILGRMMGQIELIRRAYGDLDNVVEHGEESP